MKRCLSLTIILTMLIQLIFSSIAFATDGPVQPEYTQFEPVDVTDVVSLPTGDFVYTVPLMEVPGPEGGYPVVLSYHSGIGPNRDATWVGLGWSLNPGSINRMVNGYPDDYKGQFQSTGFHDEGTGVRVYQNVELGCWGMNTGWDSNVGHLGTNHYWYIQMPLFKSKNFNLIGKARFGKGMKPSFGLTGNFSSFTDNKLSSFTSFGVSYSAESGVGFSISSTSNSFKSSISVSGIGAQSQATPDGNITFKTTSSTTLTIGIGAGGYDLFNYNYQRMEYEWQLDESIGEYSYGYLHQFEYLHEKIDNGNSDIKFERQEQGKYLYPTQDIYQVNAQGISGTFMPFFDIPYVLKDEYTGSKDNQGILDVQATIDGTDYNYGGLDKFGNSLNTRRELNFVNFKFLSEQGANLIYRDDVKLNPRWGSGDYYPIYPWTLSCFTIPGKYVSKKIDPIIESDGSLSGFTITDVDGKIYEYKEPIKNYTNYTKSVSTSNDSRWSYTHSMSEYATSFLLTAIKGPDYVDRGTINVIDDADWGYWMKFKYKDYDKVNYRSPYEGTAPSMTTREKISSYGLRDYKLLESIESKSHVAIFDVDISNDRPDTGDLEGAFLIPTDISYRTDPNYGAMLYIFMKGDWREYYNNVIKDDDVFCTFTMNAHWHCQLEDRYDYDDYYITKSNVLAIDYLSDDDHTRFKLNKAIYCFGGFYTNEAKDKKFYMVSDVDGVDRKQLSTVKLYNKADPYVVYNSATNDWYIQSGAKSIKTAEFDYDYSLCKGFISDNRNQGKLTLKGVQFYGDNGKDCGVPPYKFGYDYNPYYCDPNAAYHTNNWDNWGSYRDPNCYLGSGFYRHRTPQDKQYADNAKAWSLTDVTTPTGARVKIEYESDDYYHASNWIDIGGLGSQLNFVTPTWGQYTNSFNTSQMGDGADILDKYLNGEIRIGDYIVMYRVDVSNNVYYDLRMIENLEYSSSQNTLEITFDGDDYYWYSLCLYHVSFYPQKIYGGGIRVKSITNSDGPSHYKTIYKYDNNGYSTGVTASLPPRYLPPPDGGQTIICAQGEELQRLYLDHEKSYGRPSPNVLYSKVTVSQVNASDQPINGHSEYEFYTSKDAPYEVIGDNITIFKNRSSIYGSLKSISHYEQLDNGLSRIIEKSSHDYAFSDELHNHAILLDKDHPDASNSINFSNKPLGMIQEKYLFSNEYSDNNYYDRLIDRQIINVYPLGTTLTQYYYGDPKSTTYSNKSETISKNIAWDALSGQTIASVSFDSKDNAKISKSEPAYWIYDEMENKNMLTQNSLGTTYYSDALNSDSDLRNYTFPNSDITSSQAKTWRNWGNNIWRVDDTYMATSIGNSYQEFNDWTTYDEESTGDFPAGWKRTSNITEYDNYSHPTEERGLDGTYNSSIYGYNGALPIAIATNAKREEIVFRNFEEDGNSTDEKTGAKAATYSGSTINGETIKTPNVTPQSGKYIVSAWIKNSGSWDYYAIKLDPNITISLPSSGVVDDLRIYPVNATMKTFTYDLLNWKLKSITDENCVITYFEYDEIGRLKKVMDQDKNILKTHKYIYGRDLNN